MSSPSSPKPFEGAQRKFRYMQTSPGIKAGFDDLNLSSKASHIPESSSSNFQTSKPAAKNTKSSLQTTPSIEKTNASESKTSPNRRKPANSSSKHGPEYSPESKVMAFTDSESNSSYQETEIWDSELEDTSMDLDSLLSTNFDSKGHRCSPRTPKLKFSSLSLQSLSRTPTKKVKRSPRGRSLTTTELSATPRPRKRAPLNSTSIFPKSESSSSWMNMSPEPIVTPNISPPSNLSCFDNLSAFGVRYSRSGNSTRVSIDRPNTQTANLNECNQSNEARVSVGLSSDGTSGVSLSKKRPHESGNDEKDNKRSKIVVLKLKKT